MTPTSTDEEFLSDEDNDLARLDDAALWAWWNHWFSSALRRLATPTISASTATASSPSNRASSTWSSDAGSRDEPLRHRRISAGCSAQPQWPQASDGRRITVNPRSVLSRLHRSRDTPPIDTAAEATEATAGDFCASEGTRPKFGHYIGERR